MCCILSQVWTGLDEATQSQSLFTCCMLNDMCHHISLIQQQLLAASWTLRSQRITQLYINYVLAMYSVENFTQRGRSHVLSETMSHLMKISLSNWIRLCSCVVFSFYISDDVSKFSDGDTESNHILSLARLSKIYSNPDSQYIGVLN